MELLWRRSLRGLCWIGQRDRIRREWTLFGITRSVMMTRLLASRTGRTPSRVSYKLFVLSILFFIFLGKDGVGLF
jgi:hypothetical protein